MFVPLTWLPLSLRLGCALLAGAIIGLEREGQGKSAGLRTNILVSFGSALALLVTIQTGAAQQSAEAFSRALQGVITGVGFIGAGTIFRDRKVHGLTSAAAIWVSSALGLTAASGLYGLSVIGAILTWIILRGLDKLENKL